MRSPRIFLAIAVVVLTLVASAALAASVARVTGGGQVAMSTDPEAAEDTLAFEAQQFANETVRGQVEYVPTGGEDGQEVSTGYWHGIVQCAEIDAEDGEAIIGGVKSRASAPGERGERFDIFIQDVDAPGDDMIVLEADGDGDCQIDNGEEFSLVRGQAQIRQNG